MCFFNVLFIHARMCEPISTKNILSIPLYVSAKCTHDGPVVSEIQPKIID